MGMFLPAHRARSHRRRVLGGSYGDKVLATGPIAYWPLYETSGTTAACLTNPAMNAIYNSDVSTWPVGTGIGDGNTAPGFDGTNDCVCWNAGGIAALSAVFNGATGSCMIWCKVANVGVWTDAITRSAVRIYDDSENYYSHLKPIANNTSRGLGEAGNGFAFLDNTPYTSIDWFHALITWSDANNADEFRYYVDAAQIGAASAALNAWAGAGLDISNTAIGASTTAPTSPWHGWLAHCAVWDRVLTAPEIAALATG